MTIEKGTPVHLLLLKFDAWLKVQPEWVAIMASPRTTRRAAAKELANRLYTIPTVAASTVSDVPKALKKKTMQDLASAAREEATRQVKQEIAERAERLIADAAAAELERLRLEEEGRTDEEKATKGGVLLETPVEGTGASEPVFDPEGEVKADVQAAKDAMANEGGPAEVEEMQSVGFIETDETAPAGESETEE